MMTPHLSNPVILARSNLTTNPALKTHLEDFISDAFLRSQLPWPERWDFTLRRFRPGTDLVDMLGGEGLLCVIYDDNEEGPKIEQGTGRVVACAAAIPWQGGWMKEGKGVEEGWEIKTVCVSGEERYAGKGLAIKVMSVLEENVIRRELARTAASDAADHTVGDTKTSETGAFTFWVLLADCINGPYWKKRGYKEVRRSTVGEGTWGCKTAFDMVTSRKVVPLVTNVGGNIDS